MEKKQILKIVLILSALITPFIVLAQSEGVVDFPDPLEGRGFEDILKAITTILKAIAVPVGTIMIVWGGIQYLTSAGNEEKIKRAKKMILYALIGVAVVFAVDFIIGIVTEILGVSE